MVSSTSQAGTSEFTWEKQKPRDRAPFTRRSARTFFKRETKEMEHNKNLELKSKEFIKLSHKTWSFFFFLNEPNQLQAI